MNQSQTIVIKYGGNAMTNETLRQAILQEAADLHLAGHRLVLVHGGGPFINTLLDQVQVPSEFIEGHRKTTDEAIKYIEMALTGEVNPAIVRAFASIDVPAVGLSGKDANLIVAKKKTPHIDGLPIDIGWVGEVTDVNTKILHILLENGMLPVVTCTASDASGNALNINGDLVAGHIAGAMQADKYVVLTDVDGLYRDFNNPETLIPHLTTDDIKGLIGTTISGGMLPKMDSCLVALANGAKEVGIINGTKKGTLKAFINNETPGTRITK